MIQNRVAEARSLEKEYQGLSFDDYDKFFDENYDKLSELTDTLTVKEKETFSPALHRMFINFSLYDMISGEKRKLDKIAKIYGEIATDYGKVKYGGGGYAPLDVIMFNYVCPNGKWAKYKNYDTALKFLNYIKKVGIMGTDLHSIYKDCAKKNFHYFILNLKAIESGVYTKYDLDDSLMINRPVWKDTSSNYTDDSEEKVRTRPYSIAKPFVYQDIDIDDYIDLDLENIVKASKTQHEFELKIDEALLEIDARSEKFIEFVKLSKQVFVLDRLFAPLKIPFSMSNENTSLSEREIKFPAPKFRCYSSIENSDYHYGTDLYEASADSEIVRIETKHFNEVFDLKNPKKFYNQMTFDDLYHVYEWLKAAKGRFLPSLAVVKSFRVSEIESFYTNGNNKRYGELARLGAFDNMKTQMELLKFARVLGLFNESEVVSKKAFDFISQNLLDEINKDENEFSFIWQGGFYENYNKDFAEFYMVNKAKDKNCFVDDNGDNKLSQIYKEFDKILQFFEGKKIKTTTNRKRLEIKDIMQMLGDVRYKYNLTEKDEPLMPFITEIDRYNVDVNDALEILPKAVEAEERGVIIPLIESEINGLKYRTLKKTEPEAFYTGIKSNCCFTFKNGARSSFIDSITSTTSRVLTITGEKTYLQGWLWYDEKNQFACFDNFEGYYSHKDYTPEQIVKTMIAAADEIIMWLNSNGYPCKKINLGIHGESLQSEISCQANAGEIKFEPEINLDYVNQRKLYSDARYKQFILTDPDLLEMRIARNAQNVINLEDTKEQDKKETAAGSPTGMGE